MASCLSLDDIQSWEYTDEEFVYDLMVAKNHNYFIYAGKSILVHNSGKTYTILQVLFVKCIEENGIVVTVCGQDIPNLKKGALRDALRIYNSSPELKKCVADFNKSDRIFSFKNGSLMEFNSYEDEQDAKSGKRDYLFVNEANGVPWEIYWQLQIRTFKQRYLDYNPHSGFWVHDKLIGKPGVQLFISDYRDNPFLEPELRREIEMISDDEMWKVYARGKTGNLKGTIYPDWQVIEKFPDDDIEEMIWGIDYGYTVDPTAIVKIGISKTQHRTVYIDEIAYKPGIDEFQIRDVLIAAGYSANDDIYSEHDKEKVTQLRCLGLSVLLALKGEGSVSNGILKVKHFRVFYTMRSINLHMERLRYKWEYVGDTPTNKPDKSPDHCFVADTKIMTVSGEKNISEICPGEWIFNSQGIDKVVNIHYNGYREVLRYQINCITFTINIICTPNHKVKTKKGWKEIQHIRPGDVIFLCKNFKDEPTDYTKVNDTCQMDQGECTVKSGSIIMDQSQKDMTSIMSMAKRLITELKTWILSKPGNTSQSMVNKECETSMLKRNSTKPESKHQRIGISPNREGNGINTMQKASASGNNNTTSPVWYATRDSLAEGRRRNSVRSTANQNTEEANGPMMSREHVKGVGNPLMLIDTVKQPIAQEHVVHSIDGTPEGKMPVFDLTIDKHPEFFANGILVHNCLDAIRYAIYSRFFRD